MKLRYKFVRWIMFALGTTLVLLVSYKIFWLGSRPPIGQLLIVLFTIGMTAFCGLVIPAAMQSMDEGSEQLTRLLDNARLRKKDND